MHPFKLGFILLFTSLGNTFAQGSLTPPGAPGPTMKTLDQIESRKPIPGGTTPVTISTSGSYYLTGNITVASGDVISVDANNVTLDLNGFTLTTTSATPSGTAVFIKQGVFRCTISNGFIQGTGYGTTATYSGGGFQDGVNTEGPVAENMFVHDLVVNGCSRYGIFVNSSGYGANRVERCSVENVGGTGIVATIVRGCTVFYCVNMGISAYDTSDCYAEAQVLGISTGNANNCMGRGITGVGLACTTARGCTGVSQSANGLNASEASACNGSSSGAGIGVNTSTAVSCRGDSVSGFGLFAITATGCQGISKSGIGLQVGTGSDCSGTTTSGTYGAYGNLLNNCQGFCNSGTGTGLGAYYGGTNCLGISASGYGIDAESGLSNSYGQTGGAGFSGIFCPGTLNTCRGYHSAGGFAILASIAIGCTSAGGTISGTKFLGTP